MLTIEDFTAADLADLSQRLTTDDRAELEAAGLGVDCLEGVPAKALRWHGRLVCLFGVVPQGAGGVPWMLCTDTLREVPRRQMTEVSRCVVAEWRARFDRLTNYVHRHHAQALRFVRWLGFTIDETPAGPDGQFYVFTWERPNV